MKTMLKKMKVALFGEPHPNQEILDLIRRHEKSDPRFADDLRAALYRSEELELSKK